MKTKYAHTVSFVGI